MLLTDNCAGYNPVMPYPRGLDYLHIYKCYLPCLENETSEFQAEILKQKKKLLVQFTDESCNPENHVTEIGYNGLYSFLSKSPAKMK